MPLTDVLQKIRSSAIDLGQGVYKGLGYIVDDTLPESMDPTCLLPFATGIACGAKEEDLIPLVSPLVLLAIALRIIDDCADQDSPDALYQMIGMGRAINASVALQTVALQALYQLPLSPERHDRLVNHYFEAVLEVCQGQEQDLYHRVSSLAKYEQIVQAKTVSAYRFAAVAGGYIATDDPDTLTKLALCGEHLGWMVQILDDIESLWLAGENGDLSRKRFTYPILLGLSLDHPQSPYLKELCAQTPHDRTEICRILDEMDVRRQLMSLALDHRDNALNALSSPPQAQGQQILQLWLDWLFGDAKRLLGH